MSRDVHRLATQLDFFRLLAFYNSGRERERRVGEGVQGRRGGVYISLALPPACLTVARGPGTSTLHPASACAQDVPGGLHLRPRSGPC